MFQTHTVAFNELPGRADPDSAPPLRGKTRHHHGAIKCKRPHDNIWVQRLSGSMPLCVCACCSSSARPQRERPILEHDTHCLNMQARHDFDGEPPLGLDFGRTLIAVTLSLTIMLFCSQSTPSLSHLQAPVGLNFLFDNPGWETR